MNTVDEKDKLTARMGVRFTDEEHQRLLAEADAHGTTVSKLVRAKVIGARITSRVDAKAVAELRRQGGLLKDLAAQLREHSDGDARPKINQALAEIITAIKRVGGAS